jgi:hypothetical protein
MKVQDFFSVVQLGVGIHAGTAILQLSGELGIAPVERRVAALQSWLQEEKETGHDLEDENDKLSIIRSDITVYRIRYEKLYRRSVGWTFTFGCVLAIGLAVMSFIADAQIHEPWGTAIIVMCFLPATVIFAYLWHTSSSNLVPIKRKLSALEDRALNPE